MTTNPKSKIKNSKAQLKIKNYFTFLMVVFNFSFLIFNLTPALAQTYSADKGAQELCASGPCPIESPEDIFRLLSNIVVWTYRAFFIAAIFFIILAAFNFLTAKGAPEKVKSARNQIVWAVVAIAIALISIGAAQIISSFIKNT